MPTIGACTQIPVQLVLWELVLKKRSHQLTVKCGKADGLACLCALCLAVQRKTLLVGGIEVLEGPLESIHRSCPSAGRRSNLLLAVNLIPKDVQ
jgi:hypothetical protein